MRHVRNLRLVFVVLCGFAALWLYLPPPVIRPAPLSPGEAAPAPVSCQASATPDRGWVFPCLEELKDA